jgi:hypothetical protein
MLRMSPPGLRTGRTDRKPDNQNPRRRLLLRVGVVTTFAVSTAFLLAHRSSSERVSPYYYFYSGSGSSRNRVNFSLDPNRIAVAGTKLSPAELEERLKRGGIPFHAVTTFQENSLLIQLRTTEEAISDSPSARRPVETSLQKVSAVVGDLPAALVTPVLQRRTDRNQVVLTGDIEIRLRPNLRPETESRLLAELKEMGLDEVKTAMSPRPLPPPPHPGGKLIPGVASVQMSTSRQMHCRTRNGFTVLDLAQRLARHPQIASVEPLRLERDESANDSYGGAYPSEIITHNNCWGLEGYWGLHAWDAWGQTRGQVRVQAAIFDKGVSEHWELNGSTDYHSGDPDDNLRGYDLLDGAITIAPPPDTTFVADPHGTKVAGCLNAGWNNNNESTVGMADLIRVVSMRTRGNNQYQPQGTIARGLVQCNLQGIRISSYSLANVNPGPLDTIAYRQTQAHGMVHFAAAGTAGQFYGGDVNREIASVPAQYSSVIGIGGTKPDGRRMNEGTGDRSSTRGSGTQFFVPGLDIYTIEGRSQFGTWSGTSFSAPYAAGTAALMLSMNPGLSSLEVWQILRVTSRLTQNSLDLPPSEKDLLETPQIGGHFRQGNDGTWFDRQTSWGLIDAGEAVRLAGKLWAADMAVGTDGKIRILATGGEPVTSGASGAAGLACVSVLNSSNQIIERCTLEPRPGWAAHSISVDNNQETRVLWTQMEHTPVGMPGDYYKVALETINTATGAVTYRKELTIDDNWHVKTMRANASGNFYLLWKHKNGSVAVEKYDSSFTPVTYRYFVNTWTYYAPEDLTIDNQGNVNLLWVSLMTGGFKVQITDSNLNPLLESSEYGLDLGYPSGATAMNPSLWATTKLECAPDGRVYVFFEMTDGSGTYWTFERGSAGQSVLLYKREDRYLTPPPPATEPAGTPTSKTSKIGATVIEPPSDWLNATNNYPFTGWTIKAVGIHNDSGPLILWNRYDREVALWKCLSYPARMANLNAPIFTPTGFPARNLYGQAQPVKFLRAVEPGNYHLVLTTSNTELLGVTHLTANANPWKRRGPVGWVYENGNDRPGLVKLWRLHLPSTGDRLWTISPSEYNSCVNNGWIEEPSSLYVFNSPGPNRKPVMRLLHRNHDWLHFFTDDPTEYNQLKLTTHYDEGIAFYVEGETNP